MPNEISKRRPIPAIVLVRDTSGEVVVKGIHRFIMRPTSKILFLEDAYLNCVSVTTTE